ncbi:MAG: hypothetical protein GXY83_20030 [Rhodopirellula sp.]|nr:hypothetical protein [Rhodopirellula sp.]
MPMINGKHVVFDSPETEAAFNRMTGRSSGGGGGGGAKAVIVIGVILAVIGGIVWWIVK